MDCHEHNAARIDAPYPPIRVDGKNAAYRRMMLDNCGGRNSEMSAVASYLYSNLILLGPYSEIAETYMDISIVEMHHLHIFGQFACLLGGDPRLWSPGRSGPQYWTAAYVSYPQTLPEILNVSILEEQAAIRKYRAQARQIADPNIVAMLNRIIEDEEHHIQLFRMMQEKYLA